MNIMIAPMRTNPGSKKEKLLFLTLSVFSETGGIQKVCRTISSALADLMVNENELLVLSLCDHTKDLDNRYLKTGWFKGFGYNKFWFTLFAIQKSLGATKILLSHVNLIPIVFLIKLIRPATKVILLIHGTEVWRALPCWKSSFLRSKVSIWSVSNFTAQQTVRRHGIAPENIQVLHNCLDPFFPVPANFSKPPRLLKKYKLTEIQPVLLLITRISRHEREKGYDLLIECLPGLLKEFPDLCYLMAGKTDHEERQRLSDLLIKNNLQDHVKLLGFIPEEELINHYLLADIFILTSKKEGFGLVLIEAAACGRKIICGGQDGSKEAILDGKLGEIIDPDNSAQLQSTIRQLLKAESNSNKTRSIQQTCIQHFNYLTYKQHVNKLLHTDTPSHI
ncbi:glycosyltransferase family 4 protein [Pedobacter immunditicola]|uniref:glycosyltransferase family 4 protein n=1 Tax=Pedobacter immunditicola TaxID=3133440 RepID=UPI0030A94027